MSRNLGRTRQTPSDYKKKPTGRQMEFNSVYIGKVKDNRDVRHMGRLSVWIPELSKAEDDETGWILVSYCSPFAGATSVNPKENPKSGNENTYNQTQHAYGFWAVPPDLNVQVMVVFASGDQSKGYWMGCIYDDQMNFSVPDHASDDGKTPKTEYNRKTAGLGSLQNPPRPTYIPLYEGLVTQGIEKDTIRGITSSSARRRGDHGENTDPRSTDRITHSFKPSKVYGISTPQGHSITMDDGYKNDEGSLIRFRTRSGTQILINEEEGFIYMISKNGKTWFELEDDGTLGNVDIYAETNISLHSLSGNINLKAGNDINLQAGNDFNLLVGGETKLEGNDNINIYSSSKVKITASNNIENKAGGKSLTTASQVHLNSAGNAASSAARTIGKSTFAPPIQKNGVWTAGEKYTGKQNIIPRVPQHEPWPIHFRHKELPTEKLITTKSPTPVKENEKDVSPRVEATPSNDYGTKTTDKKLDFEPPKTTPEPKSGVGNLSSGETQAYLDALGQRESSSRYNAVNSLNYVGKYQMGTAALEDTGYIKKGTTAKGNDRGNQLSLNDPSNWTGKDGIYSKEDFLNSQNAQESAIQNYTGRNYKTLKRLNVIDEKTSSTDVAGYLAASHLGGVGAARDLKNNKERTDAYGSSTSEYFTIGSTAVNQYNNGEI